MSEKPDTWTTTSSRIIADCRVFKVREVAFDDHESIVSQLVPLQELEDLMQNGEIMHSIAIYYAQRYLRNEGLIN